jgi:hypothetical protein
VPLSVTIKNRRDPENENTIREICWANKRVMPSLAINRIRWLHDDKPQKSEKTRGTVIMSLPTQELQYEVVAQGYCNRLSDLRCKAILAKPGG